MTNRHTARRIRLRSALPSTLVLCLVSLASAGAETPGMAPETSQSAELRWKFTEGTELVYKQTVHNEMELPQGMGTSVTDIESTQRWGILDDPSDLYHERQRCQPSPSNL